MTFLFCDSSFDPLRREGFTAFLRLEHLSPDALNLDLCAKNIHFYFFERTTNTSLELQGVLVALASLTDGTHTKVITDCEQIPNLIQRRIRLELAHYTNKKGQPLTHASLYQTFFSEYDRLDLHFQWVKGHKPTQKRNAMERIFAQVDQAVRQRLRSHVLRT